MILVLDFMDKNSTKKFVWKLYLPLGLWIFLLSITKNIGIIVLVTVLAYFLIDKKFFAALYTFISYLIFKFPFELFERLFWSESASALKGQFGEILYKNPYNAAAGTENFSGMVNRYFDNLEIYLSKHFLNSVCLRNPDKVDSSLLPAILLVILFCIGLIYAFRKNKTMFFIGLYLFLATNATFIALQQFWGQLRMIVIYSPMIILFLLWTLWEISHIKKLGIIKYLLIILVIFIFFKSFGETVRKAKANQEVLSKNITGNKYYGFTPDWINFLRMSEWVGKNLPDDVSVASRKPSMSFIYSKGKEFYGIYRIPLESGDSIINRFKAEKQKICIFDLNGLSRRNVPGMTQLQIRRSTEAVIGQSSGLYGIHQLDNSSDNAIIKACKGYDIPYYLETDTFLNILQQNKEEYYGIYPDSLLNNLRKNKVEYIIMASLRINPNMKTDRTVNTIQRYLYFIELKYFNLFTVVQQIGKDDDEPAKLIKINYERLGY